jgi:CheY-like chemotaxis protein
VGETGDGLETVRLVERLQPDDDVGKPSSKSRKGCSQTPLFPGRRAPLATILIVDDNPSIRQFLLTLLGYGGHRLVEASDGNEALEKVRAQRPDLIITDLAMPGLSGYDFARQLRGSSESGPTPPVIFYTATYDEREARSLARRAGLSM